MLARLVPSLRVDYFWPLSSKEGQIRIAIMERGMINKDKYSNLIVKKKTLLLSRKFASRNEIIMSYIVCHKSGMTIRPKQ